MTSYGSSTRASAAKSGKTKQRSVNSPDYFVRHKGGPLHTMAALQKMRREQLVLLATKFCIVPTGMSNGALINNILLQQAEALADSTVLPVEMRLTLLENAIKSLEACIVEVGAALHAYEEDFGRMMSRLGYSREPRTTMLKYRNRFAIR